MADNITVSPGSGATIRTDEQSGIHILFNYVATAPPTVMSGQQTLSVTTTADVTLTVPTNATHALMTVDTGGGDIRYWENNTSPSSTQGLLVTAGSAAELVNLSQVRMRSTSGTVAVNISYRRYDV